jgi:NAD+ synthetase
MRLALAQINPIVGDIAANADRIARFTAQARDARADLVVFPELALCGYPPKDLLMQEGFVDACAAAAKRLGERHSAGLTLVFGTPLPGGTDAAAPGAGGGVANSLLAYCDGAMLAYYDKRLLPTYDVFDENRYFVPGRTPCIIDVDGWPVGLSVCEDLWRGQDVGFAHRYANQPDPVDDLVSAGARLIVNPSASPFVMGKGARHRDLLRTHARDRRLFVAAVNQVGGNDELVFDGHAGVFAPSGDLIAAGRGFEEDLVVIDLASGGPGVPPVHAPVPDPALLTPDLEQLYHALVLGVRDYARKTGFSTAVLGLSGGIDSAVVCVLAAAALGPANVSGVSLPSRYSSPGSKTDAAALAQRLGVRLTTLPIEPAFAALLGTLEAPFAGRPADVTEENLQSRVRGTLLMAMSNKFGSLLLTTGNKSELAVGYCTLYGDMNGGLAVISDVAKTQVYALARWMNDHWPRLGIPGLSGPPIPEASITKAPSAELRENQTDQDSLPPYDVLDEILRRYVEDRQAPARIVRETGFDAAIVARVLRLIDVSEFKRKQAAIGLKVTGVAFGSGRRWPIAQRYRPDLTAG